MQGLKALTPEIAILSEEAADVPYEASRHWTRFCLADPLDVRRVFMVCTDVFTANIALIEADYVRFGLVGVLARGVLYWGGAGLGSWRRQGDGPAEPIRCRAPAEPLRVVASRRHSSPDQEALLERLRTARNLELTNV